MRGYLSNDHARGLVLAVTGILILTPDSLLIRLITVDHWSLLFWRGLMTFVTLTLWQLFSDRQTALARIQAIGAMGFLVAMPVLSTNALFEQKSFKYVMINAGYWIVTMALMGGLINAWV